MRAVSSEWKEARLGEVADYRTEKIGIDNINLKNYVSTENLSPNMGGLELAKSLPNTKKVTKFQKGNILVSNIRPYFKKIWLSDRNGGCSNDVLVLSPTELIDNSYFYYNLAQNHFFDYVMSGAKGTKMPRGDKKHILRYKINLPSLKEQKSIAHILSTIDEKIETNNQINKKLEEMAQTIFKQWFVDFEFPNENGEPYKSSGGQMVESELGMIPKGWEVVDLDNIIELHDSKRIPLSKNEREKRKGIYPYYGAASLMDYVDEYIFDGIHLLLGEDGTVIDGKGYPILQYVWGKFWVNNHAHVITGKNGISVNFLYILLQHTNVSGAITGAVQLKINQRNLKSLRVIIPQNRDIVYRFSELVNKGFERLRINSDENQVLTQLRDTLLPKLMSGQIRVPLGDEKESYN